jgi:hypothetical protein
MLSSYERQDRPLALTWAKIDDDETGCEDGGLSSVIPKVEPPVAAR